MLCNIIGNKDLIEQNFIVSELGIGIAGTYETISNEYIWMRNFNSGQHQARFGNSSNRIRDSIPEHPGGQSPVTVNTLNNVKTLIYIVHPQLNLLQDNMLKPENWFSHLHLGRAEDWIKIEQFDLIKLESASRQSSLRWTTNRVKRDSKSSVKGDNSKKDSIRRYYHWVPGTNYEYRSENNEITIGQEQFYKDLSAVSMLISSRYELKEIKIENESREIRNFHHVPVKLFHGQVPFFAGVQTPELWVDTEYAIPVFLTDIFGANKAG
jgi:CRISPR-associated protein Cas5t